MPELSISLTQIQIYKQPGWLDLLLQNFDASLLQNIPLGILAIFIPFAIVFLTDILNFKENKRSEFEKMVLNDEVLGTKKVFWLSIIGIIFFAFFTGKDTSTYLKLIAISGAIILIYLYWLPFTKILKFSEGHKSEFEEHFLRNLKLKIKFNFNKTKEKIILSWDSIWKNKEETNEEYFTDIFIGHINDAIKIEKFDLAIQLTEIYKNNIQYRNRITLINKILPKIFEWNEILWIKRGLLSDNLPTKRKIQHLFSHKYFSSIKKLILKVYERTFEVKRNFWNWGYFGNEFFVATIKDAYYPHLLISIFKEHIDKSLEKFEKMKDESEKNEYNYYIMQIFSNFCPTFFNGIPNIPANYDIWKNDFPGEWKITTPNKDKKIPYIILREFIKWSENKIFRKENEIHDKNLTDVMNGIFPNSHSSIFTAFLMLFFSRDLKQALEKDPNFYISEMSIEWYNPIGENEEETNKQLHERLKAKETLQKIETVQVIVKFFHFWPTLIVYDKDLEPNTYKNWETYTESQRKIIITKAKMEKLEKIKIEIEGDEIMKICKNDEKKEMYRKDFLELIELLLVEIQK